MSNSTKRFLASEIMEEIDKFVNKKILLQTAHMSNADYTRINNDCEALKNSIAQNLLQLAGS